MTLYVLTDEFYMPYEGTETSLVGIYSTKEKALEAINKNYESKLSDSYPRRTGYTKPTEANNYTYYDKCDYGAYYIGEVELDE